MFRLRQLLSPILFLLFLSCNNDHGYPYAIKDFRKSLQPYFTEIVSKGIVMGYDSSLKYMATNKELIQLSQSEHPVLRASAFREMLDRNSFNHFDILMNHLDDTAIVAIDEGEFGTWYETVSDYILQEARWKTQEAKKKTIDQVLTKHNYLGSAYVILLKIEPQEKYYSLIKEMATRPRRLSDGHEQKFNDIEYALYGLAKFRKQDDVKIIKKQLMKNVWYISYMSFQLMKEFPDTAYLDIFQYYHRHQFYNFSGNRRNGFTGIVPDRADPEDFIQALVVQQNEKSARLLDTMLSRLPLQTCMPDKESIESEVVMQIWQHPCPAYTTLRKKIKIKAEEILKGEIRLPIERHDEPIDTNKENIRWDD
jgi:hypothetical protein